MPSCLFYKKLSPETVCHCTSLIFHLPLAWDFYCGVVYTVDSYYLIYALIVTYMSGTKGILIQGLLFFKTKSDDCPLSLHCFRGPVLEVPCTRTSKHFTKFILSWIPHKSRGIPTLVWLSQSSLNTYCQLPTYSALAFDLLGT